MGAITPQGRGALEPRQSQKVGLSVQCAWCVLDISGTMEPHHWFPAQPVPSTLEPGSDLDSARMSRLPSVSSMEGAGGVLCVQAPTGAIPGHTPTGAAMNPTSNPMTVSSEASRAVETPAQVRLPWMWRPERSWGPTPLCHSWYSALFCFRPSVEHP